MLPSLDLQLLSVFNRGIAHPWLDPIMQFLSGNALLVPGLVALATALIVWGGRRGRVFVFMLAFVLAVGDSQVNNRLKKLFGRPRPFVDHPEVRLLAGRGPSFSMPSGHASIWGGIVSVTFLYWRRREVRALVVATGLGVGVSRMYLGVHYPSDVVVGWAVGLAYGVALARMGAWLWDRAGRRVFPAWHRGLPDLLDPDAGERGLPVAHGHWQALGWVVLAALLAGRWAYVGVPVIELSEDEAYQWVWSKRMDWSYYSKPLGIAVAHWLGTHVAGDRELGVRLLPPFMAFVLGVVLMRWIARRTDGRTGFLFVVALQATPLLAVGSILLTIDPLTVFLYTLGMLATWRALTSAGPATGWWALVGVTMAGTLLTKYFAPFQLAAVVLASWVVPGGLRAWRRPGPWVALGILALGTLPILAWNAGHGWVTFTHLGERGGLHQAWRYRPTWTVEFAGAVAGLWNPVWLGFVLVAAWAVVRGGIARWKGRAGGGDATTLEERFLACFCLPILGFYLAYTFRARVHPNWIAAAVLPGLMLATLHAHRAWRAGSRRTWAWARAGLWLGLPLVVLVHETEWVNKLVGQPLPAAMEPLKRVRGHRDLALQVAALRTNAAAGGRLPFVIADHYGRAGLLSFYMPGGKEGLPEAPVVYTLRGGRVTSQFDLWPGYEARKGEDALFVRRSPTEVGEALPRALMEQFEAVELVGEVESGHKGRVLHRHEVFRCRRLR
jgi:membrane-associated phospholipid phosphatase/4-amino-4-deoxy-L-arabinose transferase-like glycosyltransferase